MKRMWKIFGSYRGSIVSFWMLGPMFTLYERGKWTEALVGGCLVFETLADAKTFAPSFPPRRVLCADEVPLPPKGTTRFWQDDIEACWEGRGGAMPWPDGTRAFRFVYVPRGGAN